MTKLLAVLAGLGLILALLALPMATSKTDIGEIGVVYGGGPFEKGAYQETLQPASGLRFTGWFDPIYKYPTTQRSYIISNTPGVVADVSGVIEATSSNNIVVKFHTATYFDLNTNLVREFHERLGIKYQAWTDAGWNRLLADSLYQQIDRAFQTEVRKYDDEALNSDPAVLQELATNIGKNLKENVNRVLNGQWFCGVGFVHGAEECPDFEFVVSNVKLPDGVVARYEAERESEIAIDIAANAVTESVKKAESINNIKAALEEGGPDYIRYEAVKSGKVTFWVLPDDQDLTIQAPTTGAAPAPTTTVPAG